MTLTLACYGGISPGFGKRATLDNHGPILACGCYASAEDVKHDAEPLPQQQDEPTCLLRIPQ